MTVAQLISRVRAVFNENGVTSGFLTDATDLYDFINSGQNEIASRMITLQTLRKKREPFFEYQVIKPLVVMLSGKVAAGFTEVISFADLGVTDYKAAYEFFILDQDTGIKKPATLVTPAELKWNEHNVFQTANKENPQYAIRGLSEVWFRPGMQADDTLLDAVDFYYYQTPPVIVASGGGTVIELAISERAHECILYYVLAKCFDKDKELQLAQKYTEAYEKEFNILCQ